MILRDISAINKFVIYSTYISSFFVKVGESMPETYGGYNMPGDEFFYLSSMYSDKLLTEFLPKVKNRAYQRYIQIQKDILNGNEIQ